MRQSHTAVLARNEVWSGRFETEPYEAAWAREAIFFLRSLESAALEDNALEDNAVARVQISPDGIHWCDEGTEVLLPSSSDEPTFARVGSFGGWLRLVGETPEGSSVKIIAYLALKE